MRAALRRCHHITGVAVGEHDEQARSPQVSQRRLGETFGLSSEEPVMRFERMRRVLEGDRLYRDFGLPKSARRVLQRSWFMPELQILLTNAAIAASSMAGH